MLTGNVGCILGALAAFALLVAVFVKPIPVIVIVGTDFARCMLKRQA